MPKLVLCLLTRDEPERVGRMLDSALPYVDGWFVSFNGERTETPEIVQKKLGHLPGHIAYRPWVSYGHNRTEVLRLAGAAFPESYLLVVDADEVVEACPPLDSLNFQPPFDGYEVDERMAIMKQRKVRVFRAGAPWRYVGAVHEFPDCPGGSLSYLPIVVANLRDGAGSQETPQQRYRAEAAMLAKDLEADPTNGRAAFYYAQSLELAGDSAEAIAAYERRAAMPGWPEEAAYSLYRIAGIRARTPGDEALVPGAYLRAWQARPTRCEPLVDLAEWHRHRKEWHLALHAAERADTIPLPAEDRLFVYQGYYEWRALDEKALALHYTGRSAEALEVAKQLLGRVPLAQLTHVAQNAGYFRQAAGK